MTNLTDNIGHIVTAVLVIAASVVLAWHGTITGGECIGMIAGAGGFSLGGSVASSSGTPGTASSPTTTTTTSGTSSSPTAPVTDTPAPSATDTSGSL